MTVDTGDGVVKYWASRVGSFDTLTNEDRAAVSLLLDALLMQRAEMDACFARLRQSDNAFLDDDPHTWAVSKDARERNKTRDPYEKPRWAR